MVADKISKIKKWLGNNKLILLIVLLALFLRLFRISSYMTFLGDEGRDALVWLRMIREGKFTLIGPQTSIGNMYLGPLYYYLMLPFFLILGTAGPSAGVALFAGATTFFLWWVGREWFSKKVGLLAAFLYAASPVAIILSRSSWNPNVMPFFALLTIWGVWQFWQRDNFCWLGVIGISLSFAIQSHYLGLLLLPTVGIFWLIKLISLLRIKSKKNEGRQLLLWSTLGVLAFLILSIAPLIWFDLRHGFINYQSFYKFFSERQTTVNLKPYKALPQMWPLWQTAVTRLLAGTDEFLGRFLAPVILIFLLLPVLSILPFRRIAILLKEARKVVRPPFFLLMTWILTGLLGMGLYKQHIYDHYFGFLFPAVFLSLSLVLVKVWESGKVGKVISGVGLLIIVFSFLERNPLRGLPNLQMQHTAAISQKIIEEAKGQPFNLGLIAKQNYDAGYRYFLEKNSYKPLDIDAQRSRETITDQLFVICEEASCEPVTAPQAEIANFGWSKIEGEWSFPWGIKLYKLIHSQNAKN